MNPEMTPPMMALVTAHTAGMVATTNADGSPAVSPKATFVVLNPKELAFGNIRSPNTLANLRQRPAVEVCFIDVVHRKSVRIRGQASIHRKNDAPGLLREAFVAGWGPFHDHITHYVHIAVSGAELILSPAYDHGATEAELRAVNLDKLNHLD